MKMRELEQRTGVSREVIRIMIREGLLPEPHRPAKNAADYDEAHVRGITTIRALQRSSRMTLKEIKTVLNGGSVEGANAASASRHLDALLAGLFGLDRAPTVTLSSMETRLPYARNDVAAFAKIGMLELIETEGEPAISSEDARLIEIWNAIRRAGFVEEAGFPPDNIAFYLTAAKEVARNEARIFFGNNTIPISEGEAAAMLHKALPLMLDFFGLLRMKAFMAEVSAR